MVWGKNLRHECIVFWSRALAIEMCLILKRVGTGLTPRLTQQRANRFHLVVKETPHQSHPKPRPANDEKCVYCGGEGLREGGRGGREGGENVPSGKKKKKQQKNLRGVTKILVFVGSPQWAPGYLFQISCTCRHFSQAFFRPRPAGEYKVVFTYLPLRSPMSP